MMRHVFIAAATGGAVIMALFTIVLLVLGWLSRPAARPKRPVVPRPKRATVARPKPEAPEPKPKPHLVPLAGPDVAVAGPDVAVAGPDQDDHDYPSWLAGTAGLGDGYSDAGHSGADAEIAAPSWLGLTDPLADPDPDPDPPTAPAAQASPEPAASQPTTLDLVPPRDDESRWPDFLALPEETGPAAELSEPVDEPIDDPVSDPVGATQFSDPAGSAFSAAALHMLGAGPLRQPGEDDLPSQRHQVSLGDDQIEVVLARTMAEEPFDGPDEDTWLAATPQLAWAPLPYDVPDDGLAFACIGAGDEGCLFLDLAAAPGAVAITGDDDAAVRLAESIAHQLCASAVADQPISVLIVGHAIPEPHPASATSVESLRDLATASLDSSPDDTDIVFCELRSEQDALALAGHVANSQRHVVPVVLGDLPGAAWSFTAFPNPTLDDSLPPLDSSLLGSATF